MKHLLILEEANKTKFLNEVDMVLNEYNVLSTKFQRNLYYESTDTHAPVRTLRELFTAFITIGD